MKKFVLILVVLGAVVWAGWYFGWWQKLYDRSSRDGTPDGTTSAATPAEEEQAAAQLEKAKAQVNARQPNRVLAKRLFHQIVVDFPGTQAALEANLEIGDLYLKSGENAKALASFEAGLPAAKGETFERVSGEIARLRKVLGLEPGEKAPDVRNEDTVHVVRSGDTLSEIAKRYSTTFPQIKLANGLTSDRIHPGDRLKITYEMPEIRVLKRSQELQLYFKGELVKTYPVGIGRGNLTPAGNYWIGEKQKDPWWYKEEGKPPIQHGDPQNILGTRWMTLKDERGNKTSLGIHGTTEPESVPGATSAGCVRMLNKDVEELFEWVPEGTHVVIIDG